MIILDTNVISALMHQTPEVQVVGWLDQQPRTSVWTTSVTILEILFGLESMPAGRRRTSLSQSFVTVLEKLEERILAFDLVAAERTATLMAARHRKGRPGDLRDSMIAGIALAHHATLATRNTTHFADAGIAIVNPWRD